MVWQEATDAVSGMPYWHNDETGESTWDPAACGPWVQRTDPSSGAAYWWNTETDRVSWTDPSSAAAPAPAPPPPMVSGRMPLPDAANDAARESVDPDEPTLSPEASMMPAASLDRCVRSSY